MFSRNDTPPRTSILFAILFLLVIFPTALHAEDSVASAASAHNKLFQDEKYPSATQCATCHPDQFREWSASPHAYAQISPVFNSMHAKLVKDLNGTLGDFCIRCHTPVGMEQGEPIFGKNADRSATSREGVTCVACHRRIVPSGKNSGRNGIITGSIFSPVYGPKGNKELKRVIESGEFDINTDPSKSGRNIHQDAIVNPQISTPGFCGNCHDVNNPNGFRLEEAFSDYKTSPAARKGISCQDCHMGQEPGKKSGYEVKSVAIVGGKPTNPRKHANHRFIGPDYSIVHPGIYPHNVGASEFASFTDWLAFNYKAGWGTDEFEDTVPETYQFPERWKNQSERFEARRYLDANLALLKEAAEERKKLLQTGYQLENPKILTLASDKLRFSIDVKNGIEGHSVPTGFDAERLVFLRVTVRDKNGESVFRSGDLDPNGDLRDELSSYVHDGKLPKDEFLVNLQSKFLVELIRGSERGQVLTSNYSATPLPFLRPPPNATLLLGRAAGARKHRQVIPPLKTRTAEYEISDEQLSGKSGPFCAEIQLIAGMVPVNLVNAIKEVGFDYDMSPRAIADAIVAGHQVLWEKSILLDPSQTSTNEVSECTHK